MVKRKIGENKRASARKLRSANAEAAEGGQGDEFEDDGPTPEIEWLDPTKDFISPHGDVWQKDAPILIAAPTPATATATATIAATDMEIGDENENTTEANENANAANGMTMTPKIENRPTVVGILRGKSMDANPNLSIASEGEGETDADILSPSPAKKKLRVTFQEQQIFRYYHSPTLFGMKNGGKRKSARRAAKPKPNEGSLSVKMMDDSGACFSPNSAINTNFAAAAEAEGDNASVPPAFEEGTPPPEPVQLPAFSDIRPVPEAVAVAVDLLQQSDQESTKVESAPEENVFLPFPEQVVNVNHISLNINNNNNNNNNGNTSVMEKLQIMHDWIGTMLSQNQNGLPQIRQAAPSAEADRATDLVQLADFYAKEGKGDDIKSGALTLLKAMTAEERQKFFAENLLLKD